MSGDLKVNAAALEQGAADIKRGVAKIQDQLQSLHRLLAPLREDWTGESQQAYQTAQDQWNAAATDMSRLASDIGDAVMRSKQNYGDTEMNIKKIWG